MIIQLPDYVPIHHLAGRARLYLIQRLQKWHESRQAEGTPSQLSFSGATKTNLDGIAERVALSMIRANGNRADILTSSGNTVQLELTRLFWRYEPTYRKIFDAKWFDDLVNHRHVSLDTFSGDDWQEAVMTLPMFRLKEPPWYPNLIDWKHGTIDVSFLLSEQLSSGAESDERGGGSELLDVKGQSLLPLQGRLPEGLLAKFLPYHGCPVLVPLAWREALEVTLDDPAEAPDDPADETETLKMLPPVKRILAYFAEHPTATKEVFRKEVFPNMPRRGFEMHWQQATAKCPELSKPGRKRKS